MTAPLRFTVTHISGVAFTIRCGGVISDSERGLARQLVEADWPDAPIEAGRAGKLDWSFPSLHRFAAGAVSAKEAEVTPERLHPALRAAVVALRGRQGKGAVA